MSPVEVMWEWAGPEREMARTRRPGDSGENDIPQDVEDPLSRPPQLWRDHGKITGGNGGIHVVVCCCNEDDEELKVMLGSFRHEGELPCRVNISFMLDRHYGGALGEHHGETYQALRELLPLEAGSKDGEEKLETAKYDEFGCMSHTGVLGSAKIPFKLYVKGPTLPQGKRNSLVLFFDEILPTKIKRREAPEPDAVYVLDADTGHPDNGLVDLVRMWKLLMAEQETAVITCPVRPINLLESVLACSQGLEYAQVWDSVGESYFSAQSTCRSAPCMFKYGCLIEDGRGALPPCGEGAQVPALDAFSYTAASLAAMILLDTAPCEGLLVLLRQRGYDLRSCGIADAVTTVPNSLWEFYAQRRRWYAGSMTALLSHLTGREHYFQNELGRSILSTYIVVYNAYLYSGILLLPVLLTKGVSIMAARVSNRDPANGYGYWAGYDDYANMQLEWSVFGVIWAFLLVNVYAFRFKEQKQLWMWINVSSVIWIVACAAVMTGVTVVVTPWVAVVVLLAPLVVGGLKVAGASGIYWAYMAMAAVPFALMSAVHSVLILLYAVATLDSTDWGTRDVAPFDSGVTKSRAGAMRRGSRKILFFLVAGSLGAGMVMVKFSSYWVIPVVIGLALLANILKLLVSVMPSNIERSRQMAIVGQTELQRPLSLRRNRPDLSTSSASVTEAHPTHKPAGSACLTEAGSFATIEDDNPSPGTAAQLSLVLRRAAPGTKKSGSIDDCTVAMTPPRKQPQSGTSSHSRSHSQTSRPSTRSPSSGCMGLSGSFDGTVIGDDPDYSIHDDGGQSDEAGQGFKSRERGGSGSGGGKGDAHGGKAAIGGNISEATSGNASEQGSLPYPPLSAGGVGFKGLFSRSSTASSAGEYEDDGRVDAKNQLVEIELSPPAAKIAGKSSSKAASDAPPESTANEGKVSQSGADDDEPARSAEARQSSITSISTASSFSQSSGFGGKSPLGLPPSGAGVRVSGIARKRSMDSDDDRPPRMTRAHSASAQDYRGNTNGSGSGGHGIAFTGDGEVKRKSGGDWTNLLRSDSFSGLVSESTAGKPPNVPRRGSRSPASAPVAGNSTPSAPTTPSVASTSSSSSAAGGSNTSTGVSAEDNVAAGKTPSIAVVEVTTPGSTTAGGTERDIVAADDAVTGKTPPGENTADNKAASNDSTSTTTAGSTPTASTSSGKRRHWGQRPSNVDSQESISPGRLASINAKRNSRTTFVGRLGWGFGVESPDAYGSPLTRMLGNNSHLTGVRRSWGRGASSDDFEDVNPRHFHHSFDEYNDPALMRRHCIPPQGSMDSQDEGISPQEMALMQGRAAHGSSLVGSRRSWGFASSMESDDAMDVPTPTDYRMGRGGDPRRRATVGHYPFMGSRSGRGSSREPEDQRSMFRGLFAQYIVGPNDDGGDPEYDHPYGYEGGMVDAHGNWGPMVEYSEDDHDFAGNQGGTGKRRAPPVHRYPVRTSSAPNLASVHYGASPRVRVSKGHGRRVGRNRRGPRPRRAALPTVAEPWDGNHPQNSGWGIGQSHVFDSSGSSSGDEGKGKGLKGVRVLDPQMANEKRARHGDAVSGRPGVQAAGMGAAPMTSHGESNMGNSNAAAYGEAQRMGNVDAMNRGHYRAV